MIKSLIVFVCFVLSVTALHGQESEQIMQISSAYSEKISAKVSKLESTLDKKSEKTLSQLRKQEQRMRAKLMKKDSLKAKEIFGDSEKRYEDLKQKLNGDIPGKQYIPSLDTITSSLKFLQQNPEFISSVKNGKEKLNKALGNVNNLESKFQKAQEIKKFLKERKEYLKQQLNQLGTDSYRFAKELKQINKQVYYYSEQINEYKALLKDHKKAERKAIELLSKTKLFKDFMRKNSQLASLFRLPGDPDDPASQVSLAGLQTRAQVNNLIQQTIGGSANAQAQFQQNVQQAQTQLSQLKNKITQLGRSSSDDEMPEGFKPNNQKTKSFLKRLELGTNIQSKKANGYFPTTSDIGLSLGYKLNDKSVLGAGASYKMGWGKDIRHINISHQGVGLRSFVDWKVKGSWWLSGGYEMNYRSEFNSIDVLKELNAWQKSGLIGASKVISLKTKFFKKTKVQLLWDFLSYQQRPQTQALLFRVGYSFK